MVVLLLLIPLLITMVCIAVGTTIIGWLIANWFSVVAAICIVIILENRKKK